MLISLVVTLIIVGLVLWAIGQLPMDPVILRIVRVIVVVVAMLYVVRALFPGAL